MLKRLLLALADPGNAGEFFDFRAQSRGHAEATGNRHLDLSVVEIDDQGHPPPPRPGTSQDVVQAGESRGLGHMDFEIAGGLGDGFVERLYGHRIDA